MLETARGLLYVNKNVENDLPNYKEGYVFIKRTKYIDGKDVIYYALPGGHLDKGEVAEEAVIRELKEELNVNVKVKKLILEMYNKNIGKKEYFFSLEYLDGILKEGNGEEFTNPCEEKYGKYEIVIIDKAEIENYNILPIEMKELIKKAETIDLES